MKNSKNTLLNNYNKTLLILMITMIFIFASTVMIQTKASIVITPSGFTNQVGGPGGSETGLQACPVGTIAIGMEGRGVTQVDAIREGFGYLSDYATRCGTYSIDYSNNTISTEYSSSTANVTGFILASRTPVIKAVDCPEGSVLGGYSGYQKFNASHSTTIVNALKPRCSKLTIDPITKLLNIGVKSDAGIEFVVNAPSDDSTVIANADCNNNDVVTGFEGRVGELFDLFKLACGTINQTALSISIADTNYSDYVVIAVDKEDNEYEIMHKTPGIIAPGSYTMKLKNLMTLEIFENFECEKNVVTSNKPYTINLADNTINYCTIDPIKPIISIVPVIDTTIAKPAKVPEASPQTEAKIEAANSIIPKQTITDTKTTTRTGGIYISIITLLIVGVVGILIFFKLKRKN